MINIDIYNYILKCLRKKLPLRSHNTKYNIKIIFDSLIYILKNNLNWNTLIVIDNITVKTNSIYKYFLYLSKTNFFQKIVRRLNKKFFVDKINDARYCSVDSTFIANKKCCKDNIKRNPYKSNKFGFKISVITNQYDIPIDLLLTEGNKHDLTILHEHLNKKVVTTYLKDKNLLADKGYRSKNLEHILCKNGTNIIIPQQKSFYPTDNLKQIYKNRIYIEHFLVN